MSITREARIDELTDSQTKTLLQADIFRETGGKDEEDIKNMKNNPTPSSMPSGANIPNTPNTPGRF